MSDGSGLREAFYARLEETSFRSGAAVGAGALAVVGVIVTVTLTLGGHPAEAAAPPRAGSVPSAPVTHAPRPDPMSAAGRPSATSRAPAKRAAAGDRIAPAPARMPASPAAPSPSALVRPRTVPPSWPFMRPIAPPGHLWGWPGPWRRVPRRRF